MGDPALEASRRAWAAGPCPELPFVPDEGGIWTPAAMVAGAREALAPIRKAYARFRCGHGDFESFCEQLKVLIYTGEELDGE